MDELKTHDLLRLLLIENIKNKLRENYDIINEIEIDNIIEKLVNINDVIDILNFDKQDYIEDQCCARVWRKSIKVGENIYNFKKTDSRCSFKGVVKIDGCLYCNKHGKQLIDKGYLRLLRYDEECPKKDIIGYKDGEYIYGKDRVWYDTFNKQLDILLRYHNIELESLSFGMR